MSHTGAMVALRVPDPERYALSAGSDGVEPEPADELHITLVFLGEDADITDEQREHIKDAVKAVAAEYQAPGALFPATTGIFPPKEGAEEAPFWAGPQPVDEINAVREALVAEMGARGVGDLIDRTHPIYNPHVTLAYAPVGWAPEESSLPKPAPVKFGPIFTAFAGENTEYPMAPDAPKGVAKPPLTASARARIAALAAANPRHSPELLTALYLRERPRGRPGATVSQQALDAVRDWVAQANGHAALHPQGPLTRSLAPALAASAFSDPALSLAASARPKMPRVADELAAAAAENPARRALRLNRALAAAAHDGSREAAALLPLIRALVADGNSSAARSLRARRQLRDRKGRWIEMGGGVRFKVRSPGAGSRWFHGTVEGIDVPNGLVSVRLEDGRLVAVPNQKLEQPKAIIGLDGDGNEAPDLARRPAADAPDAGANDQDAPAIAAMERMLSEAEAKNPGKAVSGGHILQAATDRSLKEARDASPDAPEVTFRPTRNPLKDNDLTFSNEDVRTVEAELSRLVEGRRPPNYDTLPEDQRRAVDQAGLSQAIATLASRFNERGADPELRNAPAVREADLQPVSAPAQSADPGDPGAPETAAAVRDAAQQFMAAAGGGGSEGRPGAIVRSLNEAADLHESGQLGKDGLLEGLASWRAAAAWEAQNNGGLASHETDALAALSEDIGDIEAALGADSPGAPAGRTPAGPSATPEAEAPGGPESVQGVIDRVKSAMRDAWAARRPNQRRGGRQWGGDDRQLGGLVPLHKALRERAAVEAGEDIEIDYGTGKVTVPNAVARDYLALNDHYELEGIPLTRLRDALETNMRGPDGPLRAPEAPAEVEMPGGTEDAGVPDDLAAFADRLEDEGGAFNDVTIDEGESVGTRTREIADGLRAGEVSPELAARGLLDVADYLNDGIDPNEPANGDQAYWRDRMIQARDFLNAQAGQLRGEDPVPGEVPEGGDMPEVPEVDVPEAGDEPQPGPLDQNVEAAYDVAARLAEIDPDAGEVFGRAINRHDASEIDDAALADAADRIAAVVGRQPDYDGGPIARDLNNLAARLRGEPEQPAAPAAAFPEPDASPDMDRFAQAHDAFDEIRTNLGGQDDMRDPLASWGNAAVNVGNDYQAGRIDAQEAANVLQAVSDDIDAVLGGTDAPTDGDLIDAIDDAQAGLMQLVRDLRSGSINDAIAELPEAEQQPVPEVPESGDLEVPEAPEEPGPHIEALHEAEALANFLGGQNLPAELAGINNDYRDGNITNAEYADRIDNLADDVLADAEGAELPMRHAARLRQISEAVRTGEPLADVQGDLRDEDVAEPGALPPPEPMASPNGAYRELQNLAPFFNGIEDGDGEDAGDGIWDIADRGISGDVEIGGALSVLGDIVGDMRYDFDHGDADINLEALERAELAMNILGKFEVADPDEAEDGSPEAPAIVDPAEAPAAEGAQGAADRLQAATDKATLQRAWDSVPAQRVNERGVREFEDAALTEMIQRRFSLTHGDFEVQPGSVKVVQIGNGEPYIEFLLDVIDTRNGQLVGTGIRTLSRDNNGKLWAQHTELELQARAQGQGLGSAILSNGVANFTDLGADRIELTANISVGQYAWARAGFQWNTEHANPAAVDRMLRHVRESMNEMQADGRITDNDGILALDAKISQYETDIREHRTNPAAWPTPFELSELGRSLVAPDATNWPGKEGLLRGPEWEGVLPLRQGGPVAHQGAHDEWSQRLDPEVPAPGEGQGLADASAHHVDLNASVAQQEELVRAANEAADNLVQELGQADGNLMVATGYLSDMVVRLGRMIPNGPLADALHSFKIVLGSNRDRLDYGLIDEQEFARTMEVAGGDLMDAFMASDVPPPDQADLLFAMNDDINAAAMRGDLRRNAVAPLDELDPSPVPVQPAPSPHGLSPEAEASLRARVAEMRAAGNPFMDSIADYIENRLDGVDPGDGAPLADQVSAIQNLSDFLAEGAADPADVAVFNAASDQLGDALVQLGFPDALEIEDLEVDDEDYARMAADLSTEDLFGELEAMAGQDGPYALALRVEAENRGYTQDADGDWVEASDEDDFPVDSGGPQVFDELWSAGLEDRRILEDLEVSDLLPQERAALQAEAERRGIEGVILPELDRIEQMTDQELAEELNNIGPANQRLRDAMVTEAGKRPNIGEGEGVWSARRPPGEEPEPLTSAELEAISNMGDVDLVNELNGPGPGPGDPRFEALQDEAERRPNLEVDDDATDGDWIVVPPSAPRLQEQAAPAAEQQDDLGGNPVPDGWERVHVPEGLRSPDRETYRWTGPENITVKVTTRPNGELNYEMRIDNARSFGNWQDWDGVVLNQDAAAESANNARNGRDEEALAREQRRMAEADRLAEEQASWQREVERRAARGIDDLDRPLPEGWTRQDTFGMPGQYVSPEGYVAHITPEGQLSAVYDFGEVARADSWESLQGLLRTDAVERAHAQRDGIAEWIEREAGGDLSPEQLAAIVSAATREELSGAVNDIPWVRELRARVSDEQWVDVLQPHQVERRNQLRALDGLLAQARDIPSAAPDAPPAPVRPGLREGEDGLPQSDDMVGAWEAFDRHFADVLENGNLEPEQAAVIEQFLTEEQIARENRLDGHDGRSSYVQAISNAWIDAARRLDGSGLSRQQLSALGQRAVGPLSAMAMLDNAIVHDSPLRVPQNEVDDFAPNPPNLGHPRDRINALADRLRDSGRSVAGDLIRDVLSVHEADWGDRLAELAQGFNEQGMTVIGEELGALASSLGGAVRAPEGDEGDEGGAPGAPDAPPAPAPAAGRGMGRGPFRRDPGARVSDRNGNPISPRGRVQDRSGRLGTVWSVRDDNGIQYVTVQWDDNGRRQIRAASRLEAINPAGAAPAAPAAAPAAPNAAPAADAVDAAGFQAELARIIRMHEEGARNGFPLVTEVGQAKREIEAAIGAVAQGQNTNAKVLLRNAIRAYERAIAPGGGAADENSAYGQAVRARLAAAKALEPRVQGLVNAPPPPAPRAAPQRGPEPAFVPAGDQAGGLSPESFIAPAIPEGGQRGPLALDAPLEDAPMVNDPREPGDIAGRAVPADPDASPSLWSAWGRRAGAIARARRMRPGLAQLRQRGMSQAEAKALVSAIYGADVSRPKLDEAGNPIPGQVERLTFGTKGYWLNTTRVDHSVNADGSVSVSAGFNIMNADGERIGQSSRTLKVTSAGRVEAYNALMEIYGEENKKSGFASAFNRYMEDWYIANSVTPAKVNVSAGLSNGGFVWGLNGFRFKGPISGQIAAGRGHLSSMLRRASGPEGNVADKEQVEGLIAKLDAGVPVTPLEIALVGWRPGMGGRDTWLGKRAMNGQSWSGQKDLKPNDHVILQNRAYQNAQRNAGGRVQRGENAPAPGTELSADLSNRGPAFQSMLDTMTPGEAREAAAVIQNSKSLASLPPRLKEKLRSWSRAQIDNPAHSPEMRTGLMEVNRAALAEYVADNPARPDLGVGDVLLNATRAQLTSNSIPGFRVTRMGGSVNSPWKAVHTESGQMFFVKSESYTGMGDRELPAGALAERDVNELLRNSGWAGRGANAHSRVDPTIVVSQRLGDDMPLSARPQNAGVSGAGQIPDLADPASALRMLVLDSSIHNMDRHTGNYQMAQDADGRWWMFPLDHGISAGGHDWGYGHGNGAQWFRRLARLRGDQGSGPMSAAASREIFFKAVPDFFRKYGRAATETEIRRAISDYRGALARGTYSPGFAMNLEANLADIEASLDNLLDGLQEQASALPPAPGLPAAGGAPQI